MTDVQAIKSVSDIERVQNFLQKHYSEQHSDVFVCGINFALRISDLLNLTMADARDALNTGYLKVLESKTSHRKGARTTKKARVITLNTSSRSILSRRLLNNHTDIYLFQSNGRNVTRIKPLSRHAIYQAMVEAGHYIGRRLGTHTFRKTRGYMLHKQGVPITDICKMLNHSTPAVTMAYIGLDEDTISATYTDYSLGAV